VKIIRIRPNRDTINKAITLCPLWIAPNLITLIGLIINFSGFIIMVYYCGLQVKKLPKSKNNSKKKVQKKIQKKVQKKKVHKKVQKKF